jgi:hypothetical protein
MPAGISIDSQKDFILRHAPILDKKAKQSILSLVMAEHSESVRNGSVAGPKRGGVGGSASGSASGSAVYINLDEIAEHDPDIILHIYNIVLARRNALDQPAA